jgi:3-hydroxyisobutyrate dehydrogenase-like beta-hydroxyacid dehydrogenase
MNEKLAVGFVGLGDQGSPIARRIVDAGFPLHIWARREASLAPFADTPAVVADSAAALAAVVDVLGICVVDDDDVRDVLIEQGVLAGLRQGSVVAIHSTLLPQTVIALGAEATKRGVLLLDAPVSGGSRGAQAGTMTVMVGGDAVPLEIARPVFETFSTKIAHLGPLGSGQAMKLLNNNLAYANLVMGINAMELAAQLDMDRAVVAEVIRESSGNSTGFSILTNPETFRKITGASSNLGKDVHHLAEVARNNGCGDAPLVHIAQSATERLKRYAASL